MYIDSHCHLNLQEFISDWPEVFKKALDAGVEHIIVPGINLASSIDAISIARNNPHISACAGIHPNNADEVGITELEEITNLIAKPEIIAVGEIGLDYYRNKSSFNQIRIFQHLLHIASQEAKPVIIHSRAATEATLEILRIQKPDGLRGVWHCFDGDLDLARNLLDLGLYIGFTGNITYTNNEKIIEVIREIPLDSILIETDAPFLAPQQYRGQRNEPAYVIEVARKIAELKNITIEEVGMQTTKNATSLFNI